MPKKRRVRAVIDTQHVKGLQTLPKSAESLLKNFSWRNAVLVVCENLRLVVNILISYNKYPVS